MKVNVELIVCFPNKTWDTTLIPVEVDTQAIDLPETPHSDYYIVREDGSVDIISEEEFALHIKSEAEAKLEVGGEAEVVHIGLNFYEIVDEHEDEIDKALDLGNWTLVSEGEHPLPQVVADAIQKAAAPTNLRDAFMKAVMVDATYPVDDEPNITDDIDVWLWRSVPHRR